MRLTSLEYLQYQQKFLSNQSKLTQPQGVDSGLEVEGIHQPIIRWCNSQFPQVPFIYHRPDKKSGITLGAPDFVILYQGRTILIEAKTRVGKLSPDQLAWKMLAEKQGFEVHVCRSMEQFMEIIENKPPAPQGRDAGG
jgi:hypothetical protein